MAGNGSDHEIHGVSRMRKCAAQNHNLHVTKFAQLRCSTIIS